MASISPYPRSFDKNILSHIIKINLRIITIYHAKFAIAVKVEHEWIIDIKRKIWLRDMETWC
ncbi:hypothetical protein OFN97_00195 [Campylobacter sp. VBCF_05 NA6]|uniref:hypothetical protein n=1 Tax=unclassified Campylobacter TaxID=2593542 RepID=UPI0022E9B987|nr:MULTISPECIES: hypothetical protein [unclassified Campylobacter]MDA3057541.1 hypothetical protein [Campylobacter sp. VBCF_04 NA7]MDA3058441.1 hypothetical protein [Campylobacter sp. VBCF_05 NA6]